MRARLIVLFAPSLAVLFAPSLARADLALKRAHPGTCLERLQRAHRDYRAADPGWSPDAPPRLDADGTLSFFSAEGDGEEVDATYDAALTPARAGVSTRWRRELQRGENGVLRETWTRAARGWHATVELTCMWRDGCDGLSRWKYFLPILRAALDDCMR